MALASPLDLLAGFPGWTTEFDLLWRQEQSRQANGRTRLKDLGSPLCRGAWVTRSLSPNQLDEWCARLNALENGLQTFKAYPLSRCYPIAYPNGSWPAGTFTGSNANLSFIGSDRKSIRINQLAPNFMLSVGDYLRIGDKDLHQVMEARTASGTGAIGTEFEVRPHLWPGVVTGTAVSLVRPYCVMALVPGSVSSSADPSTGRGVVSFQAIEAR